MWLRQLKSNDTAIRKYAFNHLAGSICHQGWICTATAYAVPYFIELLQEPAVQEKENILELLADIALAEPFDEETWRHNPEVLSCEVPEHVPFKDANAAVEAGIPVYLTLLDASELPVRMQAARLLVCFPERGREFWLVLRVALEREPEEWGKANLILALGSLIEQMPEEQGFFDQRLQQSQSEPERFALALILARLAKEEAPEEVAQLLTQVMFNNPAALQKYTDVACGGGYSWSAALWVLYYLGPKRLQFLAPLLEERLARNTEADWTEVHLFAELVVFILFDGKLAEGQPLRPAPSLTERQRSLLKLLFEIKKLWGYGNFQDVLRAYGLPGKRDEMAAYLGHSLPPTKVTQAPKEQAAPPRSKDRFDLYRETIHAVYPDLRIHKTQGSVQAEAGLEDDCIIANDEFLFRFPRQAHAVEEMERVIALLRALQGRLPLPIPNPIYSSRDTREVGRAFMGHVKLPGKPLYKEMLESVDGEEAIQKLADQLASFLFALHHLPVAEFATLALPQRGTHERWESLYSRIREQLFPSMEPDVREQFAGRFEQFLNTAGNVALVPAIIHGAFGPDTILYDAKARAISGIMEFSGAGLGDPALDFAQLVGPTSYGAAFARRFERAYPGYTVLEERVRFYAAVYPLRQELQRLEQYVREPQTGRMTFYPER